MPIRVPASGPTPARVLIVGEAPGSDEERHGTPFIGVSGMELDRMLHDAGFIRAECRVTNVVPFRPPGNDIELWLTESKKDAAERRLTGFRNGQYFNELIRQGLTELAHEIRSTQPTVIIALGATALWALTGNRGITDWRGSVLPNSLVPGGPKVVPTYHPALILRQWDWRAVAVHDLRRALRESEYAEIRVPPYQFSVRPSYETCMETIATLHAKADRAVLPLSVDIETRAGFIACTGIAWSRLDALCIPQMCVETPDGYFPRDQEFAITTATRELLTHPNVRVIGQNFLYDAQYFGHHYGYVPRLVDDTMFMQHVSFAGMPKALDFLSSMYCDFHQFWKNEGKEWNPRTMPEDQLWVYNCLAGDTQVLMSDSTYKALEQVVVGDTLFAFEEVGSDKRYARRLKLAIVTNTKSTVKPVFRYSFSDGTYIDATQDHKLIATSGKHSKSQFLWKECQDLRVGERVVSCGKPWKLGFSYDDAWFAGILDGEGTVGFSRTDGKCYPRIGFSQKPGLVLNRALAVLASHGFSVRISEKPSATYVDINGGLTEQLRLLGVFKTSRLLHNFREMAWGEGLSGFSAVSRPRLVAITPLGDLPVYDITTTEGTFIANGVVVHNCKDAVITFEVWETLQKTISALGLDEVYQFQMKLWYCAFRAMLRGVRIDKELRKQLGLELLDEIAKREQELIDMLGHPLNPRSPVQMKRVFYEQLALPVQRNRKTHKPSLDDEALTKLCNKEPIIRPIVRNILEQRSIGVFNSTFVGALLDPDGRIRCSFNPAGTETYRLSSSKNAFGAGTNLQNIPKGDEDDVTLTDVDLRLPNIRKLFIPDVGCTIFDCDLSGADAQVVAWEADAKLLKQLFREKVKIHAFNARELYGNDAGPDGKREPYYSRTKQGGHLSNYGGTPRTLAATIGISVHEAERFQHRWFELHPEIRGWHRRIESELQTRRFIRNKFGYRRFYFGRVEELLPEALAWIPQSTVACVTNRAWEAIDREVHEVAVLLQVHDSLVGQYLTRCEERLLATMYPIMQITVPYDDPLIIPWGLKTSTRSWGDTEERKWPVIGAN